MWIISILYFLSRLPFLRAYPVYYDSFEYSRIAGIINFSNLAQTIAASHQPIHTFYFLTILVFKQFFLPTDKILVLISLIFGYLTIIFFFLFAEEYLDRKKALFASTVLLLFPYFFVANTNILYESALLFFQITALYFFFTGLRKEKSWRILLAGILWGLSISIFIGSLLTLPIFLLILWQSKTSKKFYSLSLLSLPSLLFPLAVDFLIFKSLPTLLAKYQFHFGDLVSLKAGLPIFLFRVFRNIALESSAILSLPSAVLMAILLGRPIFHPPASRSNFHIPSSIFWFLPPLFLMQFWHSGLYGRLGLFLIFPASLILAKTITKKWQKITLLFVLLTLLIPHLIAQTHQPPIYRYYNLIKDLPNLAFLTSDSNRFLYQKNNLPIFVFSPGNDLPEAEKFINENLKQGKTVLIDSAGLAYPSFQFDGDSYHILSKNKSGQPHIKPLLEKFKIERFKTDTQNKNIYFEKIF